MEELPKFPEPVTETEPVLELQPQRLVQGAEELPENNPSESEASLGDYERPDYLPIRLFNFNAKNRARMTISGSEAYPPDIYLMASKNFENEYGFFKYDVQAYRDVPTSEGGTGPQLVDSEVGLGFFDNRERLKAFIDDNPEIRQAAQKIGGNIEPVNQQFGYGFMICKYPEHESGAEEFTI